MLFAEKIIFVEGIAEQLLISIFAEYMGKSLEDKHISVINIGGRCFEHFLFLFDSNKKDAIKRRIACITDIDPTRKEKNNSNAKFEKCYPFEMNTESEKYDYELNSIMEKYENEIHPNIRSFTQDKVFGKTLEYQLAFENPRCQLLLTSSLKNRDEISELMSMFDDKEGLSNMLSRLRNCDENRRIKDSITNLSEKLWTDDMKKKAIIASRYLNSVGKGENALELSSILHDNLNNEEKVEFNVPEYIKEAIDWMCDDL